MPEDDSRMYWLDGFEGPAKGGMYVRNRIALDIDEYEKKFKVKIVGLGLEKDYETDKPSWNLNIVTAVGRTADEVLKSLKERGVIKTEE